jgi:hypothetical protein
MFRFDPYLRYIINNLTIYGSIDRSFLIETTYNSTKKLNEIIKNYTLENTICDFGECYYTNTLANTVFDSP